MALHKLVSKSIGKRLPRAKKGGSKHNPRGPKPAGKFRNMGSIPSKKRALPRFQTQFAGLPSKSKSKKILKDKTIRGKKLTAKQKGLFGLLAGGRRPTRLKA